MKKRENIIDFINTEEEEKSFQSLIENGFIKLITEEDGVVHMAVDIKAMKTMLGEEVEEEEYDNDIINCCNKIIGNYNKYKESKNKKFDYVGKPISECKEISLFNRMENMVSHIQYISEACTKISGKKITMEDIYNMEKYELQ